MVEGPPPLSGIQSSVPLCTTQSDLARHERGVKGGRGRGSGCQEARPLLVPLQGNGSVSPDCCSATGPLSLCGSSTAAASDQDTTGATNRATHRRQEALASHNSFLFQSNISGSMK
ncbi:hypothetical protein EYF80_024777 [Liparis tanakae]|uniref:Uncharacterized protein n=1 Tax=Liparis tanakae TaxID=230148 RepID=A0A4Z2HGN7_9TELE|nr:hypothetical protein EYF80_024777 [Liparis tanakae]